MAPQKKKRTTRRTRTRKATGGSKQGSASLSPAQQQAIATMADMDRRLGMAMTKATPAEQQKISDAFDRYGTKGFDAMPAETQALIRRLERKK